MSIKDGGQGLAPLVQSGATVVTEKDHTDGHVYRISYGFQLEAVHPHLGKPFLLGVRVPHGTHEDETFFFPFPSMR